MHSGGLLLEIVEGSAAGRQFPLTAPLDVGRDPGLPLPLNDEQVSRRHVRVMPTDGSATVEDLGSTNGTYVNDQPIHGPRELRVGDRIRVGLTVLQLRSTEELGRQPSAVRPMPPATRLEQEVLRPAGPEQLPTSQSSAAAMPSFLVEESEPAFIPPAVVGDAEAESDYRALAALVDSRVKRQTSIATFAFLAVSGLAVLIFFGVR
jgi:pSer/pThr/pTyr-binding forkhead associated (FHA) protein